jgi:hypothetical protein
MIRHLTLADYVTMPWANGRGRTLQMLRIDAPDGSLLLRLSMATVVENGPFSVFQGVDRNLTVISGPGFDLAGAVRMRADPLTPISFPGDVAVAASGVIAPSDDFNVMTGRSPSLPDVRVITDSTVMPSSGGMLYLLSLGDAQVNGRWLRKLDLWMTADKTVVSGGPLVCVAVAGVLPVG